MKLSKWAKLQGVHYLTAYRWFKAGQIKNAKQNESGSIFVMEIDSNLDEKDDIKNELRRISNELNEIIKKI
jgi:predicted site-specific integrase-resolvase